MGVVWAERDYRWPKLEVGAVTFPIRPGNGNGNGTAKRVGGHHQCHPATPKGQLLWARGATIWQQMATMVCGVHAVDRGK